MSGTAKTHKDHWGTEDKVNHTVPPGEEPKTHADHWGTEDKVNHTVPPDEEPETPVIDEEEAAS